MELTLFRPFRNLSPYRTELDRVFDNFLGTPFFSGETSRLAPALDLTENENEFLVQIELAGVDKKDVNISLKDNELIIEGEKKHQKEEKDEMSCFSERSYGSFQRVIQLPSSVNAEKVSASFENGVLEIVISKKEEEKPKKVKIEVKK